MRVGKEEVTARRKRVRGDFKPEPLCLCEHLNNAALSSGGLLFFSATRLYTVCIQCERLRARSIA